MDPTSTEEDMAMGDQNLATHMGWCPMQNAWVASWTGFTDHERHKGNRGWESTSIPLQWADPLPLLAVPGTPQVGKNYLLDEKCPVRKKTTGSSGGSNPREVPPESKWERTGNPRKPPSLNNMG
jgi:hypothetical protein